MTCPRKQQMRPHACLSWPPMCDTQMKLLAPGFNLAQSQLLWLFSDSVDRSSISLCFTFCQCAFQITTISIYIFKNLMLKKKHAVHLIGLNSINTVNNQKMRRQRRVGTTGDKLPYIFWLGVYGTNISTWLAHYV